MLPVLLGIVSVGYSVCQTSTTATIVAMLKGSRHRLLLATVAFVVINCCCCSRQLVVVVDCCCCCCSLFNIASSIKLVPKNGKGK